MLSLGWYCNMRSIKSERSLTMFSPHLDYRTGHVFPLLKCQNTAHCNYIVMRNVTILQDILHYSRTHNTRPKLTTTYSSYQLSHFNFISSGKGCLCVCPWGHGLQGGTRTHWEVSTYCMGYSQPVWCILMRFNCQYWCLLCQGLPGTLPASRMSWI